MLILRPVAERDLDDLVGLAAQLDSMNLPSDRRFLAQRIHDSLRSFAGGSRRAEAVYVFVLEDAATRHCVGTSTILAKHGTVQHPHYWLELSTEERLCSQLGRHFAHDKLTLRASDDGPTEIGGLILDPRYRRHPEKCGKALSIARFAYIAAHRDGFERGLWIFGAGERPSRLRLLLPVNVADEELAAGFAILEQALRAVAAERGVRC